MDLRSKLDSVMNEYVMKNQEHENNGYEQHSSIFKK